MVFVCENNRYARFTSAARTTAATDISVRAASYRHSGYYVGDPIPFSPTLEPAVVPGATDLVDEIRRIVALSPGP